MTRTDGTDAANFIYDTVIFKLVWAVEAVRVQAVAKEHVAAPALHGTVPSSLTYGVPSRQSALLLQAGLPSRAMAVHVLSVVPGVFLDRDGMRRWLAENAGEVESVWRDASERRLWEHFIHNGGSSSGREWEETTFIADVDWDGGTGPLAGTAVRLVEGTDGTSMIVCSPDLHRLGVLRAVPFGGRGVVRAEVEENGRIECHRFGPV